LSVDAPIYRDLGVRAINALPKSNAALAVCQSRRVRRSSAVSGWSV